MLMVHLVLTAFCIFCQSEKPDATFGLRGICSQCHDALIRQEIAEDASFARYLSPAE